MTPMQPPGQKSKISAGLLAVLIGGGLSLFCCLATLGAIAVPNFLAFKKKSTVSEVKQNLKAAFVAEKAYYAEKDEYSESVELVGFMPERGNRYRYFFSARGDMFVPGSAPDGGMHSNVGADLKKDLISGNATLQAAVPAHVMAEAGVKGTCPTCEITVVAVGNLDADPTVDVWSISTEDRVIGGEKVPAGVPHCHVNDVE